MKKKILMALSLVAVAGLSIGGTVAYFKAQDASVNTFTYGEVAIEQVQYEREIGADGKLIPSTESDAWTVDGAKDKYGYVPDRLVEYKNDKTLLPSVFAEGEIKWDDRNGNSNPSGNGSYQQSFAQVNNAPGSLQLFDDSVKNVQDNMVFVKNTGTNNAYVRTYFAFEQGDLEISDAVITSNNEITWPGYAVDMNMDMDHWHWEAVAKDVVIYDAAGNENKYVIMSATYLGAGSTNYNGILKAGTTSYVSLAQIYMKPETTQEDIALLDKNNNGKFDVLVATQAVQTDGFVGLYDTGLEDAQNAFDKAFGTGLASSPFNIKNN